MKNLNGKLNWLGKINYLYFKLFKKFSRIIGVVFGVVPEHQGKGVEMAIVKAYSWVAHTPNYPYKTMEMKWIGDFNPKMMKVAQFVGGKVHKVHITYRKLFDETKPFKRCPVIT